MRVVRDFEYYDLPIDLPINRTAFELVDWTESFEERTVSGRAALAVTFAGEMRERISNALEILNPGSYLSDLFVRACLHRAACRVGIETQASSSVISLSVKPSSCARRMKRSRSTAALS